jgi:hypothetical protein
MAGLSGFLTLSQWPDRPDWYGFDRRLDTMPSRPITSLLEHQLAVSVGVVDHGNAGEPAIGMKPVIYLVHLITRNSFGLMTRKLSVTESQRSAQFRGTFSRRKLSVASANWAHVA